MPALSCSARSLVCEEPDAVLGLGTVRVVKFEIRYRSKDATARVVKSFDDVRAFYEAIQGSTPWFDLSAFADADSGGGGGSGGSGGGSGGGGVAGALGSASDLLTLLRSSDVADAFHVARERQVRFSLREAARPRRVRNPNRVATRARRRRRRAVTAVTR